VLGGGDEARNGSKRGRQAPVLKFRRTSYPLLGLAKPVPHGERPQRVSPHAHDSRDFLDLATALFDPPRVDPLWSE
jgi:hypothetical protein